MSEQSPAPIELDIRFGLADHLSLQLFVMRHQMLRGVLIFFGFAAAALVVIPLLSGMSLPGVWHAIGRKWIFYVSVLVGVFVAIRLAYLLAMCWNWRSGKLPREMRASISAAGVSYSARGVDVQVGWQAIKRLVRARSAYYLFYRHVVLRLPYHAFTTAERRAFDEFARQGMA